MARVPAPRRFIQEQGPGFTPLQASDYDGGRSIARAGARLGATVSGVADAQDKLDAQIDEANAKLGDVGYIDDARPLLEEFSAKQGVNALNAREGTEKALKDIYDRRLGAAKSPRERAMLKGVLDRRLSQDMTGIGRYAVEQSNVYADGVSLVRQTAAGQDARRFADDPTQFEIHLETGRGEIASRGERKGWGAEVIRAEQAEYESNLYAGVASDKATTDPMAAQKWLDDHRDKIDPAKADQLDKMLHGSVLRQQADQRADEMRGTASGGGDLPRGIRNHNAGNIRAVPGVQWQGQVGVDAGGFVIFDKPENGLRAIDKNLASYLKKGFDTPLKIANRWAPKGDGANDPNAYAAQIARSAGVGVNDMIGADKIPSIRGAIVRVENGAGSPSSGGGPKNRPQSVDLNGQLARVDQMGLPYEEAEALKEALTRKAGVDRQLLSQRESDAYDEATRRVLALGDGFTSVGQLGEAYLNASPQQQATLTGIAKQNAKGSAATTDPETYYGLRQIEATNPVEFAKLDPMEYRTKLSATDWKDLVDRQSRVLNKDGKPSPYAIDRGRLFSIAKTAMAAGGMDVSGGKLDPKAAQDRLNFIDRMADMQEQWQRANPNKVADDQTIRGWAGRLLMTVDGKRIYEADQDDLADKMSPKVRGLISRRLTAGGHPVTEQNIVDYYRRALIRGRF